MKTLRQSWTALRALLILTLVLGLVYPLAITAIAQLGFGDRANGQLVRVDGEVVGSAIIGQSFTDAEGAALPEWFQSRPSAAGSGYDGGASSGSNYGPENEDLIAAIAERRDAIGELDGAAAAEIPADAVTASASGLDPHISPEYARLQVPRVAEARGLDEPAVAKLVESMIQGRDLGYLGEPTVNVLQLNIALAEMDK
ncbi:K+-transporting ATPase ATPase C chain [Microbacteriaceae bacterium SG_E_30_P1]|uniref:Potassium-transporting ATPase KdpC subunit n=1 Tax=Antiquaquibacter oligotrophicus TaxID=2880260 RepID=A0ABT6KQR6_9MICO|nr:potassium-transporting ATPase subunit KdpC [Antiquaquibacter oligotrophicus]MDH6182156.1 K+-transporting ATPase ATPase C chain [Antiquaquibacter oligotrophicus]UDF12181.1 potassium-transporting ATPase subunit KdpC [Antiquaquibacter oligotrophicus]